MYFVATLLGILTKSFRIRPNILLPAFLYHKMVNRAADYKTQHDIKRLEASESYCKELQQYDLGSASTRCPKIRACRIS